MCRFSAEKIHDIGRDELLSYLETAADVAETISQEADDKWIIKSLSMR